MADTILIVLTGTTGSGQGRETQVVNEHFPLESFLSSYGNGMVQSDEPDWGALQALAKEGKTAAVTAQMAQLTKQLTGANAKSVAQQITDAVCKYLVKERDFVISDSDPGKSVYYISKGNIKPTANQANGNTAWTVVAAAPFGTS